MTQQSSAQARLTLHHAFERFARTVSPDDKRVLTNTTLKDVREEAIKIEQQLRARRTQRNMARLEPFLRGMENYSKVVEVLCNGTPYLSWIWAPVKLMLMITVNSLTAFEKLVEAYGKIADTLPRFDRLATALSHDHNFQALLALFYADILEFHRRAYKFVRRRAWAKFFTSLWDDFESRFGDILGSLANHSKLVDKEAVAVNISDTVARSKKEADRWEQQDREEQARKVRAVLSWLATDDPPPEDALDRHTRDCLPGSCEWFIQHQKTQSWLRDGADNAILWLYGKPGAGKSVLCSSLVQHAEAKGSNIFVYFCSYLGNSTESSSRLLRSLAAQIISKHQDLALHIYHNYSQTHPTPSRKALLDLLPELLQSLDSVRFVIDGIDEWDELEQKEVVQNLTKMQSTDPSSCICKILLASRDTLAISRSLPKKIKTTVSISLSGGDEGTAVGRSIGHFVDSKLSDLPDHFDELDPDASILAQVKHTLLERSNGMFLWVRLVLDSLEAVYRPEDLRSLVEDLPSDLETLYRRILQRLCSTRGAGSYGEVSKILSWICFSQRPLHKLELLHGLASSPSDGAQGAKSVPMPQILDHCKPFIEERPDSTIAFVHFSVKEFLLKSNATEVIPQCQAQLNMSFSCATTLIRGLDLLHKSATPLEYRMRILSGTYRLLPYALQYWIEHCLRYAASGGALEPERLLPHRLTELRKKHGQFLQTSKSGELADTNSLKALDDWPDDDRLKYMAHLPINDLMREVLRVRWSTGQQRCKNGEGAEAFVTQNDRTLFSRLSADFESAVIYLLSQDEVEDVPKRTLEAFQKSYASTAFRCRFPNCSRSSTGFPSSELRGQHEEAHFRRVYCKAESCQWNIGFKNKNALDTHMRKHHGEKSVFPIPPKVGRTPDDGEDDKRKTQGETNDSRTDAPDMSDRKDVLNGRKVPANEVEDTLTQTTDDLWSLNIDDVPEKWKKEGNGWYAISNPDVTRVLEVELVFTCPLETVVTDVCFSPDGRYVAACGDRRAFIFNPHTGAELANLPHLDSANPEEEVYVRGVCFSFDGKFLATGSDDKIVRVWDVEQRSVFSMFTGHEQEVYGIDFSPSGRHVASCGGDRTVRIWNIETRQQSGPFLADGILSKVMFAADEKFVFAASMHGTFYVWDVLHGHLVGYIEANQSVYDIKLLSNYRFVTAFLDNTLQLSGPVLADSAEEFASLNRMRGHKDLVLSAAITGEWIISGSADRTLGIWDSNTGVPLIVLLAHKKSVYRVATSPFGDLFATASADMRMRIWRLKPYNRDGGKKTATEGNPSASSRNPGEQALNSDATSDMSSITGNKTRSGSPEVEFVSSRRISPK